MLDMTAAAEVDGQRFDGVDIFLSLPHTDIDSTDDQLKELADQVAARNLVIGSLVAPSGSRPAEARRWVRKKSAKPS